MQITGFKIREQIRKLELRRDTAVHQFEGSLHAFTAENKPDPRAIMGTIVTCERKIAQLQRLQSQYNLRVRVMVGQTGMTLCEAVKAVGGAGRIEKMWRTALGGGRERHLYADPDRIRREGEEHARPVLSHDEILKQATIAADYAGEIRSAIAEGNGTFVDFEGDADLFE